MKNVFMNAKTAFNKNVVLPVTSFMMTMGAASMPVYADGNDVKETVNNTAAPFINNLIGIISLFGKYIGAALGAWGVIQLALAFKNEDADSKSRALMLIIAAIILFNVEGIIHLLGLNV